MALIFLIVELAGLMLLFKYTMIFIANTTIESFSYGLPVLAAFPFC
jgi:hypothetical protein